MSSTNLLIIAVQDKSKYSLTDLMIAFTGVVAQRSGPQVTDLHVRRLLRYVFAKDRDGKGIQRSLKQLAYLLDLPTATCRRVVDRAAKHFGLLIVQSQHHDSGKQTINRYAINWPAVSEKCRTSVAASSLPEQTHQPHIDSSNNENAPLRPSSSSAVKGPSRTGSSGYRLQASGYRKMKSSPVVHLRLARTPTCSDQAPQNCPCGSHFCSLRSGASKSLVRLTPLLSVIRRLKIARAARTSALSDQAPQNRSCGSHPCSLRSGASKTARAARTSALSDQAPQNCSCGSHLCSLRSGASKTARAARTGSHPCSLRSGAPKLPVRLAHRLKSMLTELKSLLPKASIDNHYETNVGTLQRT